MESVGQRIRAARVTLGVSQAVLADLLQVSAAAVSAWELDRSLPEASKLIAMRELFHISLDYLLCGAEIGLAAAVSEPAARYVSESRQLEAAIVDQLREMTPRRLRGLLAFLTSEDPCR